MITAEGARVTDSICTPGEHLKQIPTLNRVLSSASAIPLLQFVKYLRDTKLSIWSYQS